MLLHPCCHRLLLGAALLSTLACGPYSFSGSSLPSSIKTIAVPIFENQTLESAIANEVTEAVIQRFIQDNRLKVVGEGRADCVLEGRVAAYENKVHNYSAGETPEDYIVVIRVAARLRESRRNRDLWREDGLTVSAVYAVGSASGADLADEGSARSRAVGQLAEDVLALTMERW